MVGKCDIDIGLEEILWGLNMIDPGRLPSDILSTNAEYFSFASCKSPITPRSPRVIDVDNKIHRSMSY